MRLASFSKIEKLKILLLQIKQTLDDLRSNEVDVITFGQYMQPTKRHLLVKEWVTPQK